ncbi:MAG TPA: 2-phospho-L-lactate guanylyltransferase [Gaiellales bacterium]|jgi:2-phospho-L-lactate guanylyltransferase|nr:2-phospho-L-lactate guanylyltransferase [Gaiellales bacterium]
MDVQVLIPLKRLDDAKVRLIDTLTAGERRDLMLSMLRHVAVTALKAGVGPVALASSDPNAPRLARELGIGHVSDGGLPWNEGLTHALGEMEPAPETVLYLAADLPAVSPDEIRELVAAVPSHGIAIGRAYDGGTNALVVRPARALIPSFGVPRSSQAHTDLAAAAGLDARIVDLPGVAADVDTPADAARPQAREGVTSRT